MPNESGNNCAALAYAVIPLREFSDGLIFIPAE
jgi:hypothetical protein